MAEQDHEQLAEDLEREADRMQRESDRVGAEIDETRSDWHRKQADGAVPGAVAPEEPPQDTPARDTSPDAGASGAEGAPSADPPDPGTST